jgi:hypothetical protein
VRPGCVVVRPVLGQDGEQMPFAEDQHAVEQLTAQGADEPPVAAARTGGGGDRAKLERSLCVRDRSPPGNGDGRWPNLPLPGCPRPDAIASRRITAGQRTPAT